MNNKIIIMAAAALAVLILCAGCISDTSVKTTETTITTEMYVALDELSADLITLEHQVLKDLEILSKEIPYKTDSEINQILCDYYTGHPCFTAVIYRNTVDNVYISAPVFIDVDLSEYAVLTEQDFKNAGGLIVRDNVFTKYHGYQNLYYKPVYNSEGKYQGYLVFVVDVYSLIYLHPLMLGLDKTYSDYICFITNGDDKILYSSIEEAIGKVLTKEGFYDGLAYIPKVESGDGACKYTGNGFYLYNTGTKSEKITSWHTIYSSHGQRYTLYLIDEPNKPELKTEDMFTLNTQQAVNDIRGAYVYAATNSVDKLTERIKNGYYETPIDIIDMKGNIIASSEERKIGLNYLNNRGIYGVSYMESAIISTEQGGGYIYYLTPIERVVYPRASEYTLGIVMPIDNDYFLYCKIPGSADAVIIDKNLRPDLTRVTREVLEEITENGVEAVAEKINSNRGSTAEIFVPDITTKIADIAILDVLGNVYASVTFPELVGDSATFMTDVYGGSVTRKIDMLAKTGGGYMAQLYENEEKEGYVDLRVVHVEPIDTKYYVYTAAVIGTFEDVLTEAIKNTKSTE
ncbi:MAG: hypothetical protein Q4Q53_07110 [Methanocorpusculum sp.]|nr:hypothetical protein [Methanocorpusculum sp.]